MKIISLHKNYQRLIAKAAKGERSAQREMFDIFSPKMLSVCRQYAKSTDLAEEVMLTGFLKVFENLKNFKNEGSFEGWVRRIMVNESISQLRKDKKLQFDTEGKLENSIEHANYIENKLEVEDIQKMIDKLPEGYKTVFILYIIEGYKHGEIAEILNITEGTSKSQLSKARNMLQQMITNQNNTAYGTV